MRGGEVGKGVAVCVVEGTLHYVKHSGKHGILVNVVILIVTASTYVKLSVHRTTKDTGRSALSNVDIATAVSISQRAVVNGVGPKRKGANNFSGSSFGRVVNGASALALRRCRGCTRTSAIRGFCCAMAASLSNDSDVRPIASRRSSATSAIGSLFNGDSPGNLDNNQSGVGNNFSVDDTSFTIINCDSSGTVATFVRNATAVSDNTIFRRNARGCSYVVSSRLTAFGSLGMKSAFALIGPGDRSRACRLAIIKVCASSDAGRGFVSVVKQNFSSPTGRVCVDDTTTRGVMATSRSISAAIASRSANQRDRAGLSKSLDYACIFTSTSTCCAFRRRMGALKLDSSCAISSSSVSSFRGDLIPLRALNAVTK